MNLPKKGNVLRQTSGETSDPIGYAEAIASALHAELGDTHRAVKTVMKWTGASERAVKNWMSGERGPHGRYLIKILRYSDGALQTILAASRRLELLDHFLQNVVADNGAGRDGNDLPPREGAPSTNAGNDPNQDPINDPKNVPDKQDALEPNHRQQWFLTALAQSPRANAKAIQEAFGVSEKTAKRDIAALKTLGLLRFIGTRRRGRYVSATRR